MMDKQGQEQDGKTTKKLHVQHHCLAASFAGAQPLAFDTIPNAVGARRALFAATNFFRATLVTNCKTSDLDYHLIDSYWQIIFT